MSTHGFSSHNHDTCVASGMDAAIAYCEAKGLRFTPVRRRVLEILLTEHKAMGAYDILKMLATEGLGSQPPVAYRALDFLTKHGFVHKVERLNAYVACGHPGTDHAPAFMICTKCEKVVESQARAGVGLSSEADTIGFEIQAMVVEAEGICPNCRT